MKINADTRISAVLKLHPDALEAIVSIHPHYKKLRNPVLRKLMAGRTSIRQAAKIAGCKPEDFFRKLEPLGFEIERSVTPEETEQIKLPAFMIGLTQKNMETFDVRPILASGSDPLQQILQKINSIKEGGVLKIVNTFEPVPLISLLKKQGFESHTMIRPDGIFETYFHKPGAVSEIVPTAGGPVAEDWAARMEQFRNRMTETDVRSFEMPQPMMMILEALEKLPAGNALFVHHKRVPVFLLPELQERGLEYRLREIDADNVQMLIFPK